MPEEAFYRLELLEEEVNNNYTVFSFLPLDKNYFYRSGSIFVYSNTLLTKLEILWGTHKAKELLAQPLNNTSYLYKFENINFSILFSTNVRIRIVYDNAPTEIAIFLNYSLPINTPIDLYGKKQEFC